MAIKRIFNVRSRTGSRCLKCNRDINPKEWIDGREYECPYCGQMHLVAKKGRVVKIALKDQKRENEQLQKENEKLRRKIERLEGKENVFQNERTKETDEECV